MPGDGVKWESITMISIDCLLICENKYLPEVYLGKWNYKIKNK